MSDYNLGQWLGNGCAPWSNIYNVGQNHMFIKADSMLSCFGLDPNKKLPDSSQIPNSK